MATYVPSQPRIQNPDSCRNVLAKIYATNLAELTFFKLIQGHPMDLFLKISVLHANFCWLGDVEEIIVLGRKVLLGKKIIQGVRGV